MTASTITGPEATFSAPGTPPAESAAPKGRRARARWHYTIGQKLVLILQDGLIKPATAGVPPGEKPIVWFSSNPNWEPTACKATFDENGVFSRLTMAETADLGGGLVRFAVAPETAPHDWRALKDLSGMAGWMAQHLYREGITQGARPGDWWGTFDPVPRSKWIAVQVYDSGRWVDVPFDK